MQRRMPLLMAVLFSVTAVLVCTTGAQATGMPAYERSLLEFINQYRQEHGLNTLRVDPGLTRLAERHSVKMFQQKKMSHRNFHERFERSGSHLCVENVGWNYSTPLKEFNGWRRSRGHAQNMLAEGIEKAGIARVGDYVTFFACK